VNIKCTRGRVKQGKTEKGGKSRDRLLNRAKEGGIIIQWFFDQN